MIALITMISIIITIRIGTTATTMSSITTSFWGSQDRSVLLALLFNPRVAMPTTKACGSEEIDLAEQITNLLERLNYAVTNMEMLHAEPGRHTLCKIARDLHCSHAGIVLRYQADFGTDEVVGNFQELTRWNDLLTPQQRSHGDHLYQQYSVEADLDFETACARGDTASTRGAMDPGLRQILEALVDLRDAKEMEILWEVLGRQGKERWNREVRRQGRSVRASWMV